MFTKDRKGRLIWRQWYETTAGKMLLVAGYLFLAAVLLCWAADVMPVQCAGTHCERVVP